MISGKTDIMEDSIMVKIQHLRSLINRGRYEEVYQQVVLLKERITLQGDNNSSAHLMRMANLGGVLIDLGSDLANEVLIQEGVDYTRKALNGAAMDDHGAVLLYNLGNGLLALGEAQYRREWQQGKLNERLRDAARCYYKAMAICAHEHVCKPDLRNQIIVNLANLLDTVGRVVEAIDLYEVALEQNPAMSEALGNKAIALFHLIWGVHGLRHRFYQEIKELLVSALSNVTPAHMPSRFEEYLREIDRIIKAHAGNIPLEEITCPKPASDFQAFLQRFCEKHKLFLSPATLLRGGSVRVCSDPWFVSRVSSKGQNSIDKYIAFMNQIKEDYILSRYLLVQSQYRTSDLDSVDNGVTLYSPMDYSVYGIYMQLLRAAFKIGVDTLDKIAFFVRDYFGVGDVPIDRTNFRNIFSRKNAPLQLRPQLAANKNRYLLALLDLSLDLRKGGRLSSIYEIRHALTHRFLVIQGIAADEEKHDGILRVSLPEFRDQTIRALQTVRSAFMYLVMAVEENERKKEISTSGQTTFVIPGIPLDKWSRWRPLNGQ